jgi:hypothetical protein
MLKANVGLSRKITRDYNSTGYSVNLDGEILAPTDDVEAVNEQIKELFDLAQEALNREIDRDQGESAIGRRDEERPKSPTNGKNGHSNGKAPAAASASTNGKNGHANGQQPTATSAPVNQQPPAQNGSQQNGSQQNGARNGNEEVATNKQIQFILTMGKRFKLSTPQLENRVVQIVGRPCGIYDLTKKEAGRVLNELTNGGQANSQSA